MQNIDLQTVQSLVNKNFSWVYIAEELRVNIRTLDRWRFITILIFIKMKREEINSRYIYIYYVYIIKN